MKLLHQEQRIKIIMDKIKNLFAKLGSCIELTDQSLLLEVSNLVIIQE